MKRIQSYNDFLLSNSLLENDESKGQWLDSQVALEISSAIAQYVDDEAKERAKKYLNIDFDQKVEATSNKLKALIRSLLNKTDNTSYSYTKVPQDAIDFQKQVKDFVIKEVEEAKKNLPLVSKAALGTMGSKWKEEYMANNKGPKGVTKMVIDKVIELLEKQKYEGDFIRTTPPPPVSFNASSADSVDTKTNEIKVDTQKFRPDGKGYLMYKVGQGQDPEKDSIGGLGDNLLYRYKVVSPGEVQLFKSDEDIKANNPIKLTSLGKGTQQLIPQKLEIPPFKIKIGNTWKQYGTQGYPMKTGYYFDAIIDILKADSQRFADDLVKTIGDKVFGS